MPILQYIEIVCAQLKLSRTLSYNTFIQNKSIPPFYYNPSLIVDRFNPLRLRIIREANLYWKQLDWSCHKKNDVYHLSRRVEIIYFVNQFILYSKLKKVIKEGKWNYDISHTLTYFLWRFEVSIYERKCVLHIIGTLSQKKLVLFQFVFDCWRNTIKHLTIAGWISI